MNLELNDDQKALHDAIVRMVSTHLEVPRIGGVLKPAEFHYADALDNELTAGEFFSVATVEGYGAVEAALLVYEVGRSPLALEAANSALVAPLLTGEILPRPIAIARAEDLPRMVRWLDRAKTLIVDLGDDVAVLSTEELDVATVHAMYAYPVGRLTAPPDLSRARRLGAGALPELHRLWRIATTLESAAAMQAAVDFTTSYVKERKVFGRPVGSFQAVQHRLSADLQAARASYWLAMRAAWSGSAADALCAALYAQQAIASINYDTHQFNGALGMTLEHDLHCWTFRLRLLQGDLGGPAAQAAALAHAVWDLPSTEAA
ncbi:acyl-CoA dehydrogenase family protein [Sphingomonas sp. CJ20]